jgi:uncharacterized protein involved in tolerance to divalent cations
MLNLSLMKGWNNKIEEKSEKILLINTDEKYVASIFDYVIKQLSTVQCVFSIKVHIWTVQPNLPTFTEIYQNSWTQEIPCI